MFTGVSEPFADNLLSLVCRRMAHALSATLCTPLYISRKFIRMTIRFGFGFVGWRITSEIGLMGIRSERPITDKRLTSLRFSANH